MKKLLSIFLKKFSSSSSTLPFLSIKMLDKLAEDSLNDQSTKEKVREYLRQQFEKDHSFSIQDFPSGSAWINTTQPLSLLRDLRGKIVLLDFFTYCCINCMHILPELEKLEKKYSIADGFVVVGVHCAKFDNEKQTGNIVSAVRRYGVRHPVMNDCDGIMWNAFDVHCWPTLILIGPSGNTLLSLTGEGHYRLLDSVIGVALDAAKEVKTLSFNSLPEIQLTDDLKSFSTLFFPGKVTSYADENTQLLAISDTGNHRIMITQPDGLILYTIGGSTRGFINGNFEDARFNAPQGLVFLNCSIVYVADTENHAIREINIKAKTVTTVAGTGEQGNDRIGGKLGTEQCISSPWDLCFGRKRNILLIAMAGLHQIWVLFLDDEHNFFVKGKKGECKAIAGSGREENRNNCYPHAAGFAQPSGLTYCPEHDSVFIADSESSSIRELSLNDGKVTAIVGGNRNPCDLFCFGDIDGAGYNARLQHALGVAWNPEEKLLYVVDSYNHKLKCIRNNCCCTVKINSKLNEPGGVCCMQNKIFIADTNNHVIKVFDPTTLSVSSLDIKPPGPQVSIHVTEEKCLNISKNGGCIAVDLNLNLGRGLSMTEGAPALWHVTFLDKNFDENIKLPEIKEKLCLKSKLLIPIPEFLNTCNINIHIKGNVYLCKGDLCTCKELIFVITLCGDENSSDNVSCEFSHILSD